MCSLTKGLKIMTKYLADENIPVTTVKALQDADMNIRNIFEIARGMEDEEILSYAFKNLGKFL